VTDPTAGGPVAGTPVGSNPAGGDPAGGGPARKPTPPRKWGVRRYLVAGVLVWLPILATIWVVTFIVHLMDSTLVLLPPAYRPLALVGFALPGVGALLAFAIVLLTGIVVSNLIGRQLVVFGEELLNRIPLVRTVYSGVKSFTESVFSQSSSFRKVVMVQYPRAGMWSIGFLTAEDVPEVTRRTGEPHACVYISNALNATAGYIVIVPRSQIVELDMSVDAAMKMIITVGVVSPQDLTQDSATQNAPPGVDSPKPPARIASR
jgi:uncharacterized membrane protein